MRTSPARRAYNVLRNYSLFAGLPKSAEALAEHTKALAEMRNAPEHQGLFDHLYSCLSILDAKSQSLLGFNSIIVAVFAIFMSGDLREAEQTAILGMGLTLVSCFLLLSVVWVHWSTTAEIKEPIHHARVLLSVRRTRTIRYRLGWYLSIAAIVSLTVLLGQRAAQTLRSSALPPKSPPTLQSAPPR